MSKKIFIALLFVFVFLSFITFKNSLPQHKNTRVYNLITPYMPFKLEKRLGGLTIINTQSKKEEKPENTVVFKRLDALEAAWGKKHLILHNGNLLSIKNDANATIKTIRLQNREEVKFVHQFFGI